ncbi:hypothetical protein MHL86_17885 [Brevibacillus laterosporus]|nr:hypothetical protein [Brevibacillus laterosporus]
MADVERKTSVFFILILFRFKVIKHKSSIQSSTGTPINSYRLQHKSMNDQTNKRDTFKFVGRF